MQPADHPSGYKTGREKACSGTCLFPAMIVSLQSSETAVQGALRGPLDLPPIPRDHSDVACPILNTIGP